MVLIDSELEQPLKELFDSAQAQAVNNYWRGFIILSGKKDYEKTLAKVVKESLKVLSEFRIKPQILYVHEDREINRERFEKFKKLLEKEAKGLPYKLNRIIFKDSQKVLGKTYDILIMDLTNALTPDDLGRLFGLVRGEGLIIALAPPLEEWPKITTTFHEHLLTPPYTLKDVKHIFEERWVKKLKEHRGIFIYNLDKKEIIKMDEFKERNVAPPKAERPKVKGKLFPEKLYNICVTEDQAKALLNFERLINNDIAYVLTADRGRGKSAAVGLGLAGLIYLAEKKKLPKKKFFIGVTAPSFSNVETLFEFLKKGLKALGIDYQEKAKGKVIKTKNAIVEFKLPPQLIERNYDLVAVDEAAGVYVKILYKIMEKYPRMVFASTIHGYEGAGRTFSVRFLKKLKENPNLEVIEFKMHEPIRYAKDDPVEKFIYDALLLDAEPAKLKNPKIETAKLIHPDKRKLFLEQEDKLREFVGIYILAHYKNRPNDVAMLADAPHHDLYYLEVEDANDENNK